MHLHAANIFAIQQWLNNDITPYLKVALWPSTLIEGGGTLSDAHMRPEASTSVTVRTIELTRETVHLDTGWMVEYARTSESFEPILFGRPITVDEFKVKRDRGTYG